MSQKSSFKSIVAGETYSISNVPAGAAIAVSPGAGGSMNVQYRISANGPLHNWPAGAVTAATADGLDVPVFQLIFSAVTADGLAEWGW